VYQPDPIRESARRAEESEAVERLLAAWRDGEDREAAFRAIFDRFFRPLVRFFQRRHIFSLQECEDLAQETFIKVYRSLDEFRSESSFDTWIFKISMNLYLNRVRDRSAQKRGAPEVPLDEEVECLPERDRDSAYDEPLHKILQDERRRMLVAALDGLSPQQRQCVLLRLKDMKYREIAEVMQISIETVKAHLFQARQELKGKLRDYFDDLNL